ncbi:MAG: glycosyltransferase, partial [Patescibacteria group bacterium]|nr:glycosyltransferase [Patescibacteria group bacterium]
MKRVKSPSILYLASFPPRECGIATFTMRLVNAIDKECNSEINSKICAINSNGTSMYNYPRKVIMQINETEMEDYVNRAYEINKKPDIKLINIQHEYGLFGGEQGEYLIPFLELLKKPFVITMHTVLPRPDEKMRKVGRIISEKASGIVVMNKTAKKLLANIYNIKNNKIHVIPHGVFHVPFPSKSRAKRKLGLSGRLVLSTFGMMSCDKGIEYAIEALPEIVSQHPNILYLIIGATHPQILKLEGERYRNKLKKIITKHKLQDNVKFYNRYLYEKEIPDFLKATDIYLYPILSREQASSGSLSDAMSCGCPAIATNNQYAKSVINKERGFLVKFRDSMGIKKALLELIQDKKMRKEMTRNTYFYTRHMTWQNVALSYFNLFNECAHIVPRRKDKLPKIKLDYIKILTDDFGIIQFANHTRPDKHSGYCLDDNARALLGCALFYEKNGEENILKLIKLYLNFIKFTQKKNGKFYNFVSYQKTFIDHSESEDTFGRAIWALGYIIGSEQLPENIKKQAKTIFNKSRKWLNELESLRAISFAILGLYHIAKLNISKDAGEKRNEKNLKNAQNDIKKLADKLAKKFNQQNPQNPDGSKWLWFEDCLTYSNYKLCEALFRAYQITKNKEYLKIAETSIKFLDSITFEKKD